MSRNEHRYRGDEMFGKLFSSMYDGTLYGHWEAMVTFQQMIILSDAVGIVERTPPAIASRTGIPIEIITKGIEVLEAPDPYSRSPEEEGRRIVRLYDDRPWGWQIVNHAKYRKMRSEEDRRTYMREYMRVHRKEKRKQQGLTDVNSKHVLTVVSPSRSRSRSRSRSNTLAQGFAQFWAEYPKKRSKGQAEKAWNKLEPDEQLGAAIMAGLRRAKTSAEWAKENGKYIQYPASWLNAKGWEDEYAATQKSIYARV